MVLHESIPKSPTVQFGSGTLPWVIHIDKKHLIFKHEALDSRSRTTSVALFHIRVHPAQRRKMGANASRALKFSPNSKILPPISSVIVIKLALYSLEKLRKNHSDLCFHKILKKMTRTRS